MEKPVSLAVCLVIALGVVSFASAATDFKYAGDQITDMVAWSSPASSSGKRWHLTWKGCNLSQSNSAVVRIMADDGTRASTLWVYSSASTKYHDYYSAAAYGKKNTLQVEVITRTQGGFLWKDGSITDSFVPMPGV